MFVSICISSVDHHLNDDNDDDLDVSGFRLQRDLYSFSILLSQLFTSCLHSRCETNA